MPTLNELWVKAPLLKGKDWLVVAKCLKFVNPEVFEKFAKGRIVLECCPENEGSLAYGKLASMIRSSNPKSITVLTVEGSPHCFALQAAVNEALYITKARVPHKHYVLVDASDVVEVDPNSIRVARYLHLVDKLVKKNPEILDELSVHSLEYKVHKEVEEEARDIKA